MKSENIRAAIVFAAVTVAVISSEACGPFFPNNLLDEGDHAVLQSPIADFQGELARMNIRSGGLRAVPPPRGQEFYEQSAEAELSSLAAALKRAKVTGDQATAILESHMAERMKLSAYLRLVSATQSYVSPGYLDTNGTWQRMPNTNPPPVFPEIAVTPGLPREFAGYFAGAIAWNRDDVAAAVQDWRNVLELPESGRHYESTWAAFMLGKIDARSNNEYNRDEAIKCFQQVRALAKDGFADPIGLATASLGEEARIWLDRKDYVRALNLYLRQFAAGDDSALMSLRFAAAAATAGTNLAPASLRPLALDTAARRVITAWLVSRHPYNDRSEGAHDEDAKLFFDRTDSWLAAVEAAGITDMESAEQFALAAYQAGDMEVAQRWVDHAKGSAVAQWLQAKLFLRAGRMEEAARVLSRVSRQLPKELPGTNTPASFAQCLFLDRNWEFHDPMAAGTQSLGELGVLQLSRREYVEALDALLRSGYWQDAAYVAERVLTTEELRRYVDRNWPALGRGKKTGTLMINDEYGPQPMDVGAGIRYLLARRMAREAATRDATAYFPANETMPYQTFLGELHQGHDESLQTDLRARNLFAAAIMARTNGMEMLGTELEPDWAVYGGDFDYGVTWHDRTTNSLKMAIKLVNDDEIARASSRHVDPDRRFHYRWQAAALAWEAAQLLPDNSDETARVLCAGGTWLKNRDPEGADKFYKALVRRCRKTDLGQQADRVRWFPAQPVAGERPRLETIEITLEVTNAVTTIDGNVVSAQYPVPGRNYVVHEDEDVYVIARALARTGFLLAVEDILKANPHLGRGPLPSGMVITIPDVSR